MNKIGFIGFGNISKMLCEGLLLKEITKSNYIYASALHLDKLKENAKKYGINYCKNNKEVIDNSDIIVLSLKKDDFIKIITLAPELDEGLLDYLSDKNIKIQAGHCIGGDLSKCTGATHLFNAMSGITHRGKSTALSSLISDTIFTEIIADGVHVSNEALKLVFKTKPADKIILISDSLPITKSSLKEINFCDETVYYDGFKATSKEGTLAGSTTLLPDIIKHLYEINMFNPENINNPYKYHNIDLKGFVEWDENWNIIRVVNEK